MRKFTFTLHALLHLKESMEKQERNNLAVITRGLHQLQAGREEMERSRGEASESYAAKLAGGMAVADTRRFTDYFRLMKDLLAEQDKKIALAQEEIEACRKRLVEALREIRVLESLRDRQYAQYLQEAQTEEEKAIDDFVTYQTNLYSQEKR
jgi:flagellar FliJ protein